MNRGGPRRGGQCTEERRKKCERDKRERPLPTLKKATTREGIRALKRRKGVQEGFGKKDLNRRGYRKKGPRSSRKK